MLRASHFSLALYVTQSGFLFCFQSSCTVDHLLFHWFWKHEQLFSLNCSETEVCKEVDHCQNCVPPLVPWKMLCPSVSLHLLNVARIVLTGTSDLYPLDLMRLVITFIPSVCFFTWTGSFRHCTCCATATSCGCCDGSERGMLRSRTQSAPSPSLCRASSLPLSGRSSSPVVRTHFWCTLISAWTDRSAK